MESLKIYDVYSMTVDIMRIGMCHCQDAVEVSRPIMSSYSSYVRFGLYRVIFSCDEYDANEDDITKENVEVREEKEESYVHFP